MILAGDVGGTKCILSLAEGTASSLRMHHEQSYASREFASLEAVIQAFLQQLRSQGKTLSIEGAAFGVAGPVVEATVKTPNLPWTITRAGLIEVLHTRNVALLNDLESAGLGIAELKPGEAEPLNAATPTPGAARTLIAAGTGLGESILVTGADGIYRPIPSEGGHCDFAARDEEEGRLLQFLQTRWPHVSYERVLSGPGLFNIYEFLRSSGGREEGSVAAAILEAADPSAAISEAALGGRSGLCRRALDLFVSIYGAEAGNLALKAKSLGGVFIGGGIAPKIRPKLTDGSFLRAFYDKGRMRPLMESIPVYLVLNDRLALLGAAAYARSLVVAPHVG